MPNKYKYVEKTRCPKCKTGFLILRTGKFGDFYGCTNFPNCKYTQRFPKNRIVTCPLCNEIDCDCEDTDLKLQS